MFPKVLLIFFCIFSALSNQINAQKPALTYKGIYLRNLRIPVGGIATGNILLGGRGQFEAIEIMNRPKREKRPPYTFFSIFTKDKNGNTCAKILERELIPPYDYVASSYLNGLPRFREVECHVPYPFIYHYFSDPDVPVKVQLETYNPFIPLNADDSGIPIVLFNWEITNPTNEVILFSISFNFRNPILSPQRVNEVYQSDFFNGIHMYSNDISNIDQKGEIIIGTTDQMTSLQTHWYKGKWQDHAQKFWDDFSVDGKLMNVVETDMVGNSNGVASVLVADILQPNQSKKIPFYLVWYFPYRTYQSNETLGIEAAANKPFQNYYATLFKSAGDVLSYFQSNESQLYRDSKAFSDIMMNSTYPVYVKEAVVSQLSSLKTQLLNRMKDGSTHGFEGVLHTGWCCPGTCTHVYNYEQTIASLFPAIERTMREVEFLHNTRDNGFQVFRAVFPLGDYYFNGSAAADGQMGSIARVYREWKYSGDNDWLQRLWPKVKLALEYAWSDENIYDWDTKRTGVLSSWQHNTYDIDFYGPNPMTSSLYLAALKACIEMAKAMNDIEAHKVYSDISLRGIENFEQHMWNDEYFYQPDLEKYESEHLDLKYQFGAGCLSDQLLGQYLAEISGLGKIVDAKKIKSALAAIYKYNFIPQVRIQQNTQRVYAHNDEAGLVLCTWPKGNKPELPFVYAYEIWTGVEYQVAATLIYNGLVSEGLEIVKAVQDRHDGYKRNPFEHNESGWHYARALSSWALIMALSGVEYDGTEKSIYFAPKSDDGTFRTFWSCGTGWGSLEINEETTTLSVEYGRLEILTFGLENIPIKSPAIDEKAIAGRYRQDNPAIIEFDQPVMLQKGQKLIFTNK